MIQFHVEKRDMEKMLHLTKPSVQKITGVIRRQYTVETSQPKIGVVSDVYCNDCHEEENTIEHPVWTSATMNMLEILEGAVKTYIGHQKNLISGWRCL